MNCPYYRIQLYLGCCYRPEIELIEQYTRLFFLLLFIELYLILFLKCTVINIKIINNHLKVTTETPFI